MNPAAARLTSLEVDLGAVRRNARRVAARAGSQVFFVVKANAYGHGAPRVAASLARHHPGCRFVVARLEEGLELRRHGVARPVLVLGAGVAGVPAAVAGEAVAAMRAERLTPGIASTEELGRWLASPAPASPAPHPVHLKADTGLGRAGLDLAELREAVARVTAAPHLRLEGLYTHLAESEDVGGEFTALQLDRFDHACATLPPGISSATIRHAANSAAALHWPRARYDAVRVGGALYGVDLAASDLRGELEPALRVAARVLQVKRLRPGDSVGYGRRFVATAPCEVALLPIGYADGLASAAAAEAEVLVRGRRARVAGAISMDLASIDVTGLGVEVGDEAVVLGEQEGQRIGVADHARWSRSTAYECLCRFSRRLAPTFRDDDTG